MATSADIVIVGGGVIGLSAAWELAQRSVSVCVVDPSAGHGASWVAAGMLAPVTEAAFGEDALVRLAMAAAAHWPGFAARLDAATGLDSGFRRCGIVVVALDASDRAAVDQLLDFQHALGLDASRLSASECRSLVPELAPGIRGGAHVPGDHQADNRKLVAALLAGCAAAGVRLVEDRVVSVELDRRGAACGVRTAAGRTLGATDVVVAAGAHTPRIAGVPEGVLPPVRPVKGHALRLRTTAARPALEHTVRGLVHGRHCYLVARDDGSVVLGATSEERGYDTSVQAGAVHALLDDARLLVPAVDEWELVECLAGLRPASPDNAPFVGPTSVPRLAVATGHYRNGILLAPLTAAAVAALFCTGAVPPPLDAFPADRSVHAGAVGSTGAVAPAPAPGR